MVVHYMDSDDEGKGKKKEKEEMRMNEDLEKEVEEEQQYIVPPMEDWIPAERAEPSLTFSPAVLPSSGDATSGNLVRSTIVGKFGRSVIIGPRPTVLKWVERHSSNTMMMVSLDQLQAHLYREAHKCSNHGRATDSGLSYELQAAVTPWIGNLLIPENSRLTVADTVREQGQKTQLSSTPFFQLFLRTMNVDNLGCKKVIEQRRNKVMSPPVPTSLKNPHTVAGILQRRKMKKDRQQMQERPQLLLKHQVQLQQLVLIQQPQPPPPRSTPVWVAPALNASPVPPPSNHHSPSPPSASTPLTETLTAQLCPHSTCATLPSSCSMPAFSPSPANPTLKPPKEREQMEVDQEAVCSRHVDVAGSDAGILRDTGEAEVSVVYI